MDVPLAGADLGIDHGEAAGACAGEVEILPDFGPGRFDLPVCIVVLAGALQFGIALPLVVKDLEEGVDRGTGRGGIETGFRPHADDDVAVGVVAAEAAVHQVADGLDAARIAQVDVSPCLNQKRPRTAYGDFRVG